MQLRFSVRFFMFFFLWAFVPSMSVAQSSLEVQLYQDVALGDEPAVKKLLSLGVNPNTQNEYGQTPLHQAAYWGYRDIVTLLLKAGANPNLRNSSQETPLFEAAYRCRGKVVKLLLAAGADPNLKKDTRHLPVPRKSDMSPMYIAVTCPSTVVSHLISHGADVNMLNENGRTALHAAADRGNIEMMKFLVSQGAKMDVRDEFGLTPQDLLKRREARLEKIAYLQ